jgi:dsRNA-specific ribonuclease
MLHGVAARRGAKIEYESESSGPQHSLKWVVTVLGESISSETFFFTLTIFTVDGEWKGQGNASNKQTAKEEAAKAAFNSLHWG